MSTLAWSPDVADAMVEAARRAHHGGEPVALEVTCDDGSTFTRTYAPAYGRFADSGPSSPAAHLPGMSTLIVGVSGKKRHGKNTTAALTRAVGVEFEQLEQPRAGRGRGRPSCCSSRMQML